MAQRGPWVPVALPDRPAEVAAMLPALLTGHPERHRAVRLGVRVAVAAAAGVAVGPRMQPIFFALTAPVFRVAPAGAAAAALAVDREVPVAVAAGEALLLLSSTQR